jgi:hypothetical protein
LQANTARSPGTTRGELSGSFAPRRSAGAMVSSTITATAPIMALARMPPVGLVVGRRLPLGEQPHWGHDPDRALTVAPQSGQAFKMGRWAHPRDAAEGGGTVFRTTPQNGQAESPDWTSKRQCGHCRRSSIAVQLPAWACLTDADVVVQAVRPLAGRNTRETGLNPQSGKARVSGPFDPSNEV